MGMSIDIDVFDVEDLKQQLKDIKRTPDLMSPDELLDKIMPEFGIVEHGLFIVQTADYWDDYCPYYEFISFLERYYQVGSVDLNRLAWRYEGANADDVAYGLKIDLPPHPYNEDEDE